MKNKTIGFHLKSKMHEVDIDYSVEEFKSVTKLSVEALIKWKFPMNIISLIIGEKIEKRITKQLKSEIFELKKLCENS